MLDIERENEVKRLQDNLLTLRTVAGWNADIFANKIDVSRQYYSELENATRKLTYSMYLAILYIYEKEGQSNKELLTVLNTCLDKEKMTEKKCQDLFKYISSERKKKTTSEDANKKLLEIFGTTAAIGIVGIIVKSLIKR